MPKIVAAAPEDIRQRLWTLYWLVRLTRQGGVVVELGTRQGDSTRALLAACEDVGSKLFSYDVEHCYRVVREVTANIGLPWFQADWQFAQQDSALAGHRWTHGSADLVYIDTDHTLATTRAEIAAWAPHVQPGGCMAFHDYWLHDPPRDGVKPAVDQFFDAHRENWSIETHDAQSDTGFAILWRHP